MGHLPLITEYKQFTSQVDKKQGNQKSCVLLLTLKRSRIRYSQTTSRPQTFWKAVQSNESTRMHYRSWFIPTLVRMYPQSGFWITLSLFHLSQNCTHICYPFLFSPSNPLKVHAHLYPLSSTQVPLPKPQHWPHWCHTTLPAVKWKLGPQHIYIEPRWCCALYHCQRIFLCSSRIFSQDAKCVALLIGKNC